jgi:hypothetical protein
MRWVPVCVVAVASVPSGIARDLLRCGESGETPRAQAGCLEVFLQGSTSVLPLKVGGKLGDLGQHVGRLAVAAGTANASALSEMVEGACREFCQSIPDCREPDGLIGCRDGVIRRHGEWVRKWNQWLLRVERGGSSQTTGCGVAFDDAFSGTGLRTVLERLLPYV